MRELPPILLTGCRPWTPALESPPPPGKACWCCGSLRDPGRICLACLSPDDRTTRRAAERRIRERVAELLGRRRDDQVVPEGAPVLTERERIEIAREHGQAGLTWLASIGQEPDRELMARVAEDLEKELGPCSS